MEAVARQARRSMRSLSASSCSSLSSLNSISGSVCSISSFTSPSPAVDLLPSNSTQAEAAVTQAEPVYGVETSQGEVPCILGKRRRKRNADKERQRQAKRQKENPRKRPFSERERVDMSKMKQGMRRAIPSGVQFEKLSRAGEVGQRDVVFDLATVKSKRVTVVQWDGV